MTHEHEVKLTEEVYNELLKEAQSLGKNYVAALKEQKRRQDTTN
jgi:hypothetical protein